VGGDVSANWTPLRALHAVSESGAVMTEQADGSILVSGPLREDDVYTVTALTTLRGITGVRLEALTDPSLPYRGPGREPLNGNFHLAEFFLDARESDEPEISQQPVSQTIASGDFVSFSVAALGSSPLTYQWYLNGSAINGATNPVLTITNATVAIAGTYNVSVGTPDASTFSAGAVLNVLPPDAETAARLWVSNRTPTNSPVYGVTGQLLEGPGFLAQVYVAREGDLFTSAGPAVPFLVGPDAGYFAPVEVILSGIVPGTPVRAIVLVWESAFGARFESAVSNGSAHASSLPISVVTGGGDLEVPFLNGLRSLSLQARPRVTRAPESVTALVGSNVSFLVEAFGSAPLAYQWRFAASDIAGANSPVLTLTNIQPAQSGAYTVVISNALGVVTSPIANLVANLPDTTPPVITITSPVADITFDDLVQLSGTVTDSGGLQSAAWTLNGAERGFLPLSNGQFSVPGIALTRGTNVFRVQAIDTSGNESVAFVTVVQQASRTLAVTPGAPQQEGGRVSVPIELVSRGDVSGVAFTLSYDPQFLQAPEVSWNSLLEGSFVQVNTNAPGSVRISFALSGLSLPGGTQQLSTVHFRARSVPWDLAVPFTLNSVGVFSVSGDSLLTGTDVFGGSSVITRRRHVGDNNANDRLDVGDASAIMRLVTLLDQPRSWDTPANDLNRNLLLDTGDVIRVLRAVVGLDPQPETGVTALAGGEPLVTLSLDRAHALPGEQVRLRVNLDSTSNAVSGASFRLRYPVDALRLEGPGSHRLGSIVPSGAVSLWNLSPSQDYATQDGIVSLAASTDGAWSSGSGTLAELVFTIQAGATNQQRWPIGLSQVELSSGYDLVSAANAQLDFLGFELPAQVQLFFDLATGDLELIVSNAEGYEIESSEDLVTWTVLEASGRIKPQDQQRFFRARLAD
jgi:hypothetical protein